MSVFVRAKAGERSDHFAQRQVLHGNLRAGNDLIEAFLCGGGVFAVRNVNRGRSDQCIAVDRRSNQNALTELSRLLENCVLHKAFGLMIEKQIVAASWRDMQLCGADHVVDNVGVNTGGVDYAACQVFAVVRADVPAAALIAAQRFNLGVKAEVHPVLKSILGHGNVHQERADDARARRVQSSYDIVRKIRLHRKRRVMIQKLQSRNTVLNALLIEAFQVGELFFIHA